MNSNKFLILLRGKDRTEDILSCDIDKFYVNIKFKNSDKIYTYSKNDIEFYNNPEKIDLNENKIYLYKGYIYNILKVLKFGSYYKIFFNNNTNLVIEERFVNIVQSDDKMILSSNKFEYFKEVSKIVSVKTEEGKELLTNEYEKINFIEKDTALYKYMTPSSKIKTTNVSELNDLIFPFGVNKSQYNAVRNAMSSQISIIEGPPRYRENSDYIKYYS